MIRALSFRLRPLAALPFRDAWGVAAASVLAAAVYFAAHARSPARPQAAVPGEGWWAWFDQGHYLRAALAWAEGSVDPARHWYLPGYPLMAAPFAQITPAQPFLLPDLACLLASLLLTAALARVLLPAGLALRGSIGAGCFVLAALAVGVARQSWVIPWTTTGATPFILAALLAALHFLRRPVPMTGFLGGLAVGTIATIRPTDLLGVLAAWAVAGLAVALQRRAGALRLGASLAAALGGCALPMGAGLAAHLAIHGWAWGPYLEGSALIGFEPKLAGLRWATAMLNARPVFPEGDGLVQMFPFIIPGMLGMAVSTAAATPARRPLHLAVIALTVSHAGLYLIYRDLHPINLWRFHNHHYFKALLPLFALYTVALVAHVPWALRHPRRCLAAWAAVALLLPWRGVEQPAGPAGPISADRHSLLIPAGLPRAGDAVRVATAASLKAVTGDRHRLVIGGATYHPFRDFAAFKDGPDMLVMTLRDLPDGPATLILSEDVTLDPAPPPLRAHLTAQPGLPCLLTWCRRAARGE